MDELDGRPGHVAPQFGHLSALTDARVESLSPLSCAQSEPSTPEHALASLGLRLHGADWANLMLRSNAPRRLHALPLNPLPVSPPGREACFGARSAAVAAAPLPLPAALCPVPGEYVSLHIAYPASLLPPRDGSAPVGFVSTQFVPEEKANENVPGK